MKKIFTLAAILFSVTTFAAGHPEPNDSKMAIRSNSDAFIQVYVDGRQYNMNCNGFLMDNIRSGRHRIEVYKVDNYGMYRRRPQLVYCDVTFVKPWESLNISINRFEKVWIETRFDRDDRRGNDRDYGRNRDYNDHNGRDRDYGHDRDYNNGPDHNNGPDYNDRDGHNRH